MYMVLSIYDNYYTIFEQQVNCLFSIKLLLCSIAIALLTYCLLFIDRLIKVLDILGL